jgi:hypothetical protein
MAKIPTSFPETPTDHSQPLLLFLRQCFSKFACTIATARVCGNTILRLLTATFDAA